MRLQINDCTMLRKKPFQHLNRATNFFKGTHKLRNLLNGQNQKIIFAHPLKLQLLPFV
jgi:hypothetical protein